MYGSGIRLFVGCLVTVCGTVGFGQERGPSSSVGPYVLPSVEGVKTRSILTVGDEVGGYKLAGIPDGLGAMLDPDGTTFTLLVNHEIARGAGLSRAHGEKGAFVSRWTIDKATLAVVKGGDLTSSPDHLHTWIREDQKYKTGAAFMERLCSGDLPAASALFHDGKGTTERLYLNGEEVYPPDSDNHGRAFAHVVTGPSAGHTWELPRVGRISFENVLVSPFGQGKTVVMLMDDAKENKERTVRSELYLYVGDKTDMGTEIERAGLTHGLLYGAILENQDKPVAGEQDKFGYAAVAPPVYSARVRWHLFGKVPNLDGNALQAMSIAEGLTSFLRIEDGAWDPRPEGARDFYFTTTASFDKNSRLHRIRFDDLSQPEKGGQIETLLKGDEGHKMADNMAMDRLGRILIQEDVGENDRLGKIWVYSTKTGALVEVAAHSPEHFLKSKSEFITTDEEASGIIDAADILGEGWFLLTVQAHKKRNDDLVEEGQLLAMFVDPKIGMAAPK